MRPAAFTLESPVTIAEALRALADGGGAARPLAGGQSLIAQLTRRELAVDRLVDLSGITELREFDVTAGTLRIGAMVTAADLEDNAAVAEGWPLLAEAVRHVGHRPVRTRATVGGMLAFGDEPAEIPLALAVLDADVLVQTPGAELHMHAARCTLRPGELITAITVPPYPGTHGFCEVSRRLNDRALAVAAALMVRAADSSWTLRLGVATATCAAAVIELSDWRPELDPSTAAQLALQTSNHDEYQHRALGEAARRATAQALERRNESV